MKNVYSSPSSIVFLLLAVALCVFTYIGTVDPKDFIILATAAFMHYFKRGDKDKPVDNAIVNDPQLG